MKRMIATSLMLSNVAFAAPLIKVKRPETPKPFAKDCADLEGSWKGSCSLNGADMGADQSLTIEQYGCESIDFDGNLDGTFSIDGLTTVSDYGPSSADVYTVGFRWNAGRSGLLATVQGHSISRDGDPTGSIVEGDAQLTLTEDVLNLVAKMSSKPDGADSFDMACVYSKEKNPDSK
ncbi:MAG: hypothetical protein AB7T49_00445 [Oligoflexales bacterium]